MIDGMIDDLIYADNEADLAEIQARLSRQYPTVTFEDGSDFIHPYRIVVNIAVNAPTEDEYFVWLILNGMINVSLALNLILMGDLPHGQRLLDLVKAARAANIQA